MFGLLDRTQRAAQSLAEALTVAPPPQAMPGPGPAPGLAPMGPPMAPGLGGQRPPGAGPQTMLSTPANPLSVMPSFRTPPMAAVLQGPRGQEAQMPKPGFARGGLAVFKEGSR